MTELDLNRTLLLDIRSLLLKAVDLIERRLMIGKYKTQMVSVEARDSIAGTVYQVETVTIEEKKDDKLSLV